MERIPVGKIECPPLAEVRVLGVLDWAMRDYAQSLARPDFDLPPVIVFYDGERYWLADGHHRRAAYILADRVLIPADVREGGERDAVKYALSANEGQVGLPRTNADRRRAVRIALKDAEWKHWSDPEIARLCAVDPMTVLRAREVVQAEEQTSLMQRRSDRPSLPHCGSEPPVMPPPLIQQAKAQGKARPRVYKTKHGTTATMDTARIGSATKGRQPNVPIINPKIVRDHGKRLELLRAIRVLMESMNIDPDAAWQEAKVTP